MSRNAKQPVDPAFIDGILKGLANRPNVQSTLILSRNDGTIIRATGFPLIGPDATIANRAYDRNQPNEPTTEIAGLQITSPSAEEEESLKQFITPVQRLASTIYEFVNASSKVVASISETADRAATAAGERTHSLGTNSHEQNTEQRAIADDADVQLLRMRTKRQEIIIFPDPNYLCCVVQKISKAATRNDTA